MKKQDILSRVDHTLLKPTATWEEIKKLCDEAVKFHTASVCVPQTYVKQIKEYYGDSLKICTVIGFPLGYNSGPSKVNEAMYSIAEGADEIDMVINVIDVKNGNYNKVEKEIAAIKAVCGKKILKVIVETCYLTDLEKMKMCNVVQNAGADFIKTSTGFGTDGAKIADVKLFKSRLKDSVKVKAAGGISTIEDLKAFVEAGSDRIGTSRAVGLLKDLPDDAEI